MPTSRPETSSQARIAVGGVPESNFIVFFFAVNNFRGREVNSRRPENNDRAWSAEFRFVI
jgi:hypothetical protein